MAQSEQLILIDGSSFLYRAYFAGKTNMSTRDGLPTGATLILTRMFKNLVKDFADSKFIAVFDAKGKSFRSEMYPEYKATRPPMPDDLRQQIEFAHSIVEAMGIPLISIPGVEADDVLGSYARAAEKQGMDVIICTCDKDLAQLVNDNIKLRDTMKHITYDEEKVKEKFGVPPRLIIDFLALKGDTSDNIPGMKGVGDVTAAALLNGLGSIFDIKENADEIKNLNFRGAAKFKDKFLEQWPAIELSYHLATIKCDVELPVAIEDLAPPVEDNDTLIAIFERLEFTTLARDQREKRTADGMNRMQGQSDSDSSAAPLLAGTPSTAGADDAGTAGAAAAPAADVGPAGEASGAGSSGETAGADLSGDDAAILTPGAPARPKRGRPRKNSTASEGADGESSTATSGRKKGATSAAEYAIQASALAEAALRAAAVAKNAAIAAEAAKEAVKAAENRSVSADILQSIAAQAVADASDAVRQSGAARKTRKSSRAKDAEAQQEAVSAAAVEGAADSGSAVGTQPATAAAAEGSGTAPASGAAAAAEAAGEITGVGTAAAEGAVPAGKGVLDIENHRNHGQVDDCRQFFRVILTRDDLEAVERDMRKAGLFSFHVTASSERPCDSTIIGLAIATSEQACYYIPLAHSYLEAPEQLTLDDIRKTLGPVFCDSGVKKTAFDLKQMRLYLHFAGIPVSGFAPDPMVITHILDSSRKVDLNMMSEGYIKYSPMDLTAVRRNSKETFDKIEIDTWKDYACERAMIFLRLHRACMDELRTFENGQELVNFDMDVLDVLYNMEVRGTYLNGEELGRQAARLREDLHMVEQDIYDLANTTFNINSPRQLGRILFEDLNIPYPRTTVKADSEGNKSYSTADDILSDISDEFDIVRKVQRYRMLSKLLSTYADKLPQLISSRTGRIHTCFNLAGTVTGRLSSTDPNLQNIPIRTPEGRQIRRAFAAPEGYQIVSADYSQIELRLIAHFARDPSLIAAFKNGKDIHRATAAEVLGKKIEDVTDEERSHAKATNFGLMYGMQAHGLARQTGMTSAQAKAYINMYFKKYPTIKDLMERIKEEAREKGYTPTLKGFHVVINGINSTGAAARAAERAAINAPMQGSAADIIKMAMVEVNRYIQTLPLNSVYLTMQVHDELIFEVRDDMVTQFTTRIRQIMENVVKLMVPLEVGIGTGPSWDEAH